MRKVTLFVVTLLLTTTMAYANCGMCALDKQKKGGDMAQKKMGKMTEELGLTEEQASQVGALHKEKMEKKKAVKEENRAEMDAIRDEYSAKIKALLTPEQQTKFDAMQKKREAEMKEKKGKMGEGHKHGRKHAEEGHEEMMKSTDEAK